MDEIAAVKVDIERTAGKLQEVKRDLDILEVRYGSRRPPNYPPGVIRCQHCKKTFPRTGDRLCPYCHEPHGNQQAR